MGDKSESIARRSGMYVAHSGGIHWIKRNSETSEEQAVPLSNFDARIVSDVTCDDGAETSRGFEIETTLEGRVSRFRVAASKFGSLAWVPEHVGASAYITAAQGSERKLREAISRLSGTIATRTVFGHTGWARLGDRWIYLHADGAIGADGLVPGVEVELPGALAHFRLPAPPEENLLHEAIVVAIGLLDLAPARIEAPLFCATWRAPLGPADFALALAGKTGNFKTELGSIVMRHFGAGFDARHLPGSWSSTANFLRALSFIAKDAPLIVDDFVPTGSRVDVSRQHRDAQALLRDTGNLAGRGRLASDASMRPIRMPRGLVISTGEQNFRGESLQGRLLTIEVCKGDVSDLAALTAAQNNASAGLFAVAMAAYLRWLAPRLDDVRAQLQSSRVALRAKAAGVGGHARTPAVVGDLYFGAQLFFRFAIDSGALPQSLADAFLNKIWDGLIEAAERQAEHVREHEPTDRFLALLHAAISSGGAHIADCEGSRPAKDALALGWRLDDARGYIPLGPCIGWIEGDDLYLNDEVALKAANAIAVDGTGVTIPASTLRKQLKEKNLLKSTGADRKRTTLTILKTVAGARLEVLHFARETVFGSDEKTIAPKEEHSDERSA